MNQKDRERRERRYREEYKPAYDELMKVYPFTLDDLPGEVWKPIPDYEGLYHESSYGRTKSFKQGKVTILKPAHHKGGYLLVTLSKDGKPKHFSVHRLVAELFIPNPEGKPQVNHIDGNKFNNCADNLEWSTCSENNQHAVVTGLVKSGTDNYNAAFTKEQILYIRNNPDNLTGKELAKMFKFNCRQKQIFNVVHSAK